jgi:hypothetical protein
MPRSAAADVGAESDEQVSRPEVESVITIRSARSDRRIDGDLLTIDPVVVD